MLKNPIFFAVCATLAITNISATQAQTEYLNHTPYANATWDASHQQHFAPAIQPTSSNYTYHYGVIVSQPISNARTQTAVPAPAPTIPYKPATNYTPVVTYAPVVRYAPANNYIPAASPMRPICNPIG